MPKTEKKQLFDESGSDEDESNLKINKNYAQRYDEWREAEIKRKLEDRYGDLDEELSSSSSDDDIDPQELEKAVNKDFFEVISQLRKKDPKIYNPKVHFFNAEEQPSTSVDKKKKDKPIYLRDYERKLIIERGGVLSDNESDVEDEERKKRALSPSLAEKEKSLKESLQKFVHSDSDDDGGLLTKKVKTKEEKKKEDDDYIEWLRGRKEELKDKSLQESLSYLKEEWNNPNLDEGEKFLRDYVLNKRYLDPEENADADTGNLTDEDYQDEYMDEFERKYNFRFEEPDSEFLKRYPRTIENSVRKKDDRRKQHREEVKKRKEEEKLRQREELKVLKSLKRKEILRKIEKLKEITGNTELGISDKDLEGDYDPEEHDRRMNELFNDDYYQEGDDEEQLDDLPLPPLEDELLDDYENWDEYEGEKEDGTQMNEELHCEDPNFNMDCDFDPEAARLEKESRPKSSRERRKLKRQSRFGTLVRKKKPEFDPKEKSFQEYLDEYYGIDYEDIVGGQPCRFKYRKVMPNSFGLTIEEILAADDKELNAWISIKKATALKPDHVELNEKRMYELKAQNEELKRKILPSLYKNETEENDEVGEHPRSRKKKSFGAYPSESNEPQDKIAGKNKKKAAANKATVEDAANKSNEDNVEVNTTVKKKKNNKNKSLDQNDVLVDGETFTQGPQEMPEEEISMSDTFQSQKVSKKEKKKLKRQLVESTSIDDTNDEGLTTKGGGGKKRSSEIREDSADLQERENKEDDNKGSTKKRKVSANSTFPQSGNEGGEVLSKPSKKSALQSGKPSEMPRPGEPNMKTNKGNKNRVLKNPITNDKKKRQRRGKDRRKLITLKKEVTDTPRDIKAENKARAVRKQNYKAAPVVGEMSDSRLRAYGLNPKKFKNKLVYG